VSAIAAAPHETVADETGEAIRLFAAGGRSLEDLILERWDDLVESGRAECPVCGGRLHAASGCEGCASDLA
jgi:hypothetical protein